MAKQIGKEAMTQLNRESDNMREKLRASGVAPSEINTRVKQSREDKIAHMKSQPGYGKTLKPSQKSENFRPNYAGKMQNARERAGLTPAKQRAEFLEYQIQQKRRLENDAKKRVVQKTLERAFHDHPREAEKIRKVVLASSKTPEEKARKKALKKERRAMAREMTGSEGSWWDPIVKAGADLIPKLLPLLIGMGDYTEEEAPLLKGEMPESNSLLAASSNGQCGTAVPYMHRKGDKVRVQHREYVGDVYSSTASFTQTSFPINPGMEELFPWCAPVANCFTYYRLMGMVADFVSQGTDYANTAGLGYVGLATQYNPLLPDFANKKEFMNYQFANAVKPSLSMTHWIECKPNDIPDAERTVRAGTIPANADLRLYDHGKLFLAVGGNTAAGAIIGMLWVSYDVEFYFPKVSGSASGVLDYYLTRRDGVLGTGELGANVVTVNTRSTMNMTFTANTIVFPGGTFGDYDVLILYSGAAASGVNGIGFASSAGITILSATTPSIMASEVVHWRHLHVSIDGTQASYTITTNGLGTCVPTGTGGVNFCDIQICEIPRAPPASNPIFDPQGLEYEQRYANFMRLHTNNGVPFDDVTARLLSRWSPNDNREKYNDAAYQRLLKKQAENLARQKDVEAVLVDRMKREILAEYREGNFTHVDAGDDDVVFDYNGLKLRYYNDPQEGWAYWAHFRGDRWEVSLNGLDFKYWRDHPPKTDDQIFLSIMNDRRLRVDRSGEKSTTDTIVPISSTSSESTTVGPDEEGMDAYTVLRRVGSYGYCSTADGHFVVRSFDPVKTKWWFLDEESGYDKVFMEVYEDLCGKEFMTVIDAIIDCQVNTGVETFAVAKAKPILFRKRGAKDYTSFLQQS